MKLSGFFSALIRAGRSADPRGKTGGAYDYADSAVLYGDPETEIGVILVGIDIEVGEILLADRLRERRKIDLVLSHHPCAQAYARLPKVVDMQAGLLKAQGISASAAEAFAGERARQLACKIAPNNVTRALDAARLLDIPFACCHTPADNFAQMFIERFISSRRAMTLGSLCERLAAVDEFAIAVKLGMGPRIANGGKNAPLGKTLVEMTGGASFNKRTYRFLAEERGIQTIVAMHLNDEQIAEAGKNGINVVITGHTASDALGMNLLLDAAIGGGKIDIIACSGFTRINRKRSCYRSK
jgi:hypothetical protein